MPRSNKSPVLCAIGAGALALGLASSSASAEDKIVIGFVTHAQGNPFIQQIVDGAQAAAGDLGVTLETAAQSGAPRRVSSSWRRTSPIPAPMASQPRCPAN